MVRTKLEIADIEFEYSEPQTIEEALALCSPRTDGTNPLLDSAVNYVEYHRVFSVLRRQLVDWIEKNSECKRARKSETNDKGVEVQVIAEKDVPFIKRAIAEDAVTEQDVQEALQELADSEANSFARFLNAERRSAGPKKLPKDIQAAVAKAEADGNLETLAGKLSAILGTEVESTAEAVGAAMHKHRKQQMDAAMRAAAAALA